MKSKKHQVLANDLGGEEQVLKPMVNPKFVPCFAGVCNPRIWVRIWEQNEIFFVVAHF
jgi:hypothetical protein